jgi:hypothetical protein
MPSIESHAGNAASERSNNRGLRLQSLLSVRMPLTLLLLVAVKCVVWIAVTPPWAPPDEPAHVAYVERLAVQHKLPAAGSFQATAYSPQETAVLGASHFYSLVGSGLEFAGMAFTQADARELRKVLGGHLSMDGALGSTWVGIRHCITF